MLVDELMTRDIHTLTGEHNLHEARLLMQSRRVRHIPIVDGEHRLVGLISQRDLLAAGPPVYPPLSAEERAAQESTISLKQIMKTELLTVGPREKLRDAALTMQAHRIGCLPVVKGQTLLGIITDTDFVGLAINLLEQLEWQAPLEDSDEPD